MHLPFKEAENSQLYELTGEDQIKINKELVRIKKEAAGLYPALCSFSVDQ